MSTTWRTVAEECWRAGDIDAATFAHGQALQAEARELPKCKTVLPSCPKCGVAFTVEHFPRHSHPAWVAWCGSDCDDVLNGGTRGDKVWRKE